MDPSAVAAYYRGKGYVVRDGVRVAGPSGNEHRVPLLAEGPLGSLAIFFGDFGGVDGPEMGGARKVAREVGATPVLAADTFTNQDRQVASRLGVVLLDAATLEGDPASAATGLGADTGRAWPGLAPVPTRRAKEPEDEPHPWPVSGRVGGLDGPGARAVDVDEILAQPKPRPPAAEADPLAPGQAQEVPGRPPTDATEGATEDATEDPGDGEGLWRKARTPVTPAPRQPRAPGSQRFAWLGGAVANAPPAKASAGPGGPLAVEYDDVVPAKGPGADASPQAPEERLGDSIELQPTLAELDRKARHDRLMARLFWILFVSVLLYLFALWWF